MSSVPEIEAAVQKPSPAELCKFRKWVEEFDADAWDKQLEPDVRAGRLEDLAEEALRDLRQGRATKL